jgi:hypothetical protein
MPVQREMYNDAKSGHVILFTDEKDKLYLDLPIFNSNGGRSDET